MLRKTVKTKFHFIMNSKKIIHCTYIYIQKSYRPTLVKWSKTVDFSSVPCFVQYLFQFMLLILDVFALKNKTYIFINICNNVYFLYLFGFFIKLTLTL